MAPLLQTFLLICVTIYAFNRPASCATQVEAPPQSPFDSENVVVLTDETFDKTVKEYQYVLVRRPNTTGHFDLVHCILP